MSKPFASSWTPDRVFYTIQGKLNKVLLPYNLNTVTV